MKTNGIDLLIRHLDIFFLIVLVLYFIIKWSGDTIPYIVRTMFDLIIPYAGFKILLYLYSK